MILNAPSPDTLGSNANPLWNWNRNTQAVQSQSQESNNLPQFQCKWEGCTRTHYFRRETDLWRHIRTIHVAPGAFRCVVGNCGKVFGRKDHFQQHVKRRHPYSHAGF
ncbi:hypothetical protein BJY04DRAFT_183708 [Aspergillus karnatakaensis]|uniref:uncharacterized protein n=1 Tax=Aspergillus karnatakaensis TaxID=1810916 RepID=UPI003CCDA186